MKYKTTETYIPPKPCIRGHFERYVKSGKCVLCGTLNWHRNKNNILPRLKREKYNLENREVRLFRERVWARKWRQENPILQILKSAKDRAKKKGLEFNLVESDIVMPKYCPVFPEIQLCKSDGRVSNNSPSLDRVDNNKGYVKGNVRIISYKANRLKNNGILEDFKRLIEYMESSSQEKN